MSVIFNKDKKMFLLSTSKTSYAMAVSPQGYLLHLYWGKKVRELHPEDALVMKMRALSPNTDPKNIDFSLDTVPLEYPAFGNSDFRSPAFEVQFKDGSFVCDPKFKEYKIINGKPSLEGLPSTYCEKGDDTETLEITLKDDLTGLLIILSYTVMSDFNVITRSVRFENSGKDNIKILRALSMSLDMRNDKFNMLQLSGAWARERSMVTRRLVPGMQTVESKRGASSAQENPFFALLSENADEIQGDVYAVNLVYSGNFLAGTEVDQFGTSRIFSGINPFEFSWLLEPEKSFQCPEAVIVYSDKGLGEMSRTFHNLYRERLCRGRFKNEERPVLINNWEATYFNFDSEKILSLAKSASKLGVDMFVLDDGWFGKRENEATSLGDWVVNKKKIPNGLNDLASSVEKLGLKFGLWFEPEMVSIDSDLYRAHKDYCIHVEGRTRTTSRIQLVLDFSREEVRAEVERMLTEIFTTVPISYVKWDMNRNITEAASKSLAPDRQGEFSHRYILGLYNLFERLTSKFPNILFEGCASGGGRFDAGILYYMPQIWTSDDTDAIERLKIQYGTSLVYPPYSISAHVSAVPNEQVGRTTPLLTRGYAAMLFNLGYELNPEKLSDDERKIIKEQIVEYKSIRKLIQHGDFYRLRNPFKENCAAFMYVSKDKKEAFSAFFNILSEPNGPLDYLLFEGLDPDKKYVEENSKKVYFGDELMNSGLPILSNTEDFKCQVWHFYEKI